MAASGDREGCTALPNAVQQGATRKRNRSIWSDARSEFWDKVAALMGRLKMNAGSTDLKWLLGIKEDGMKVDKEEAAMLFWAWRNLYAEVTRVRIEGKQLNLKTAYENFVRMSFTRVVAYGAKCGTDGTHDSDTRPKLSQPRSGSGIAS